MADQLYVVRLATVTSPAAEAPPTVKATVVVWIVSLAENERVTVSPARAISLVPLLAALSESIDTLVSVACDSAASVEVEKTTARSSRHPNISSVLCLIAVSISLSLGAV